MKESLEWCLELGIKVVTVYAFSIENFKRSEEEVSALMNLAIEKFTLFLIEGEIVQTNGVCVKFLGNLKMLPPKVLNIIAKLTQFTRKNTKFICFFFLFSFSALLNICFPYTSQDEMNNASSACVNGVKSGLLFPSDITEDLYSACLYTDRFSYPELLIRTSGETRLSDFLIYQMGFTHLEFIDVLWPELTIWNMAECIMRFQNEYDSITNDQASWKTSKMRRQKALDQNCVRTYLKNPVICFCQWLKTYSVCKENTDGNSFNSSEELAPISSNVLVSNYLFESCPDYAFHSKHFGFDDSLPLFDALIASRQFRTNTFLSSRSLSFDTWIDYLVAHPPNDKS